MTVTYPSNVNAYRTFTFHVADSVPILIELTWLQNQDIYSLAI
jgi:hypothetical protein